MPRLCDASPARGGQLPAAAEVPPALRELAGRPDAGRRLRDGGVGRRAARPRGAPWPTPSGIRAGFEAMPVGAVVGIPRGPRPRCAAGRGRRRRAGRRGPGAAEDRARVGGRAGARRADRSSGPGAPGRRQRLLPEPERGRRDPEPPGRLRRAVHRATAAAGRPRRPRAAGPRAARAHLPRRVAHHATARAGRAAQRLVRHGLPQARPPRGRARHAGRPCGVRRGRRPRVRRRLLRGGARPGLEPGARPPGSAGTRRAWSATSATRPSYLSVDPCGYPPVVGGLGPGAHGDRGSATDPTTRVLARLGARRRWFPATYT